jgi:DNA-binding transcriptional MerR regulator
VSRRRRRRLLVRISELSQATGVSVATIKYYLREGLLPAAEKRAARLADYDERHVRRLQLIKLLREVGDIPIEGLKRLVEASERTDVAIHDLFAAAAKALAPAAPPAGPLRPATRTLADQLIDAAGWTNVRPDSPDREYLAATLELIASYDTHPRDPAEIEPYVRFADQIARYEIGHLDDAKDRVGLLEEAVVGQIVFGQVLATLRRLAEEHHSQDRFGDDYRA